LDAGARVAGYAGRVAVATQRENEGTEINGALNLSPHEAVVVKPHGE
jgi:hypothetical protein